MNISRFWFSRVFSREEGLFFIVEIQLAIVPYIYHGFSVFVVSNMDWLSLLEIDEYAIAHTWSIQTCTYSHITQGSLVVVQSNDYMNNLMHSP